MSDATDMSERDERLTEISLRVSKAFDGESLHDVACVCAKAIAFALGDAYDDEDEREATLDRLVDFIRAEMLVASEWKGTGNAH